MAGDTVSPIRLVLVEDNPGDARLVQVVLATAFGNGFTLRHFDRLERAIDHLAAHDADCLLLDLSLPDAQGLDVVRMARHTCPSLALVVLSGLADEHLAMSAVQEGAQDYLIKSRVDAYLIGRSIRYAIQREHDQAALRESELRRREIFAQMMRGEEETRVRIATELHDDTIQVMTAALLALDRLSGTLARGEVDAAQKAVARARTTLHDAVERTRRLTFELRPPLLEAHGLAPALRDLAEQTAKEADFETDVRVEVGRYPFALEDLAYRIVREALTNVRKHAAAHRVEVEIRERGGHLQGFVRDDGRGFDVPTALDRSRMRLHLGLDSLVERVQLADGQVEIDSMPGRGSTVSFRIPVEPSGAARAARRAGAAVA